MAGDGDTERVDLLSTRRLALKAAVVAAAKIRTAPVRRECLGSAVELAGEIESDPDHTARIASPVAGRVESVTLKLGQEVQKGELLLSLRVPELSRLRADVASREAMSRVAKSNADRTASLASVGAASKKEAADATAEAASLHAQASAAAEVVRALGSSPDVEITNSLLTLRAPMAGTVITRNAVIGQPVLAEQTLGTIAALEQVLFVANVYEGDLAKVHTGDEALIRLNAYPDKERAGLVGYLGEQLDPATRTVKARIVLQNPDRQLHLGLFGMARINHQSCGDAPLPLVVPEGALTNVDGQPTVFVKVGDGVFEARSVTAGATFSSRVEILSGLTDGEQAVTEGAFTLKSVLLRGTLGDQD